MAEVLPPGWLSPDALAVWERLAPDLVARGVLTFWDVDAFAILCSTITVNRRALDDLETNGATLVVVARVLSDGTTTYRATTNPAWRVARESGSLIVSLSGRFGMTPSDRVQLHVSPTTARRPGRPSDGSDLLSGYGDPERLLA